jgi:hypothetical protein
MRKNELLRRPTRTRAHTCFHVSGCTFMNIFKRYKRLSLLCITKMCRYMYVFANSMIMRVVPILYRYKVLQMHILNRMIHVWLYKTPKCTVLMDIHTFTQTRCSGIFKPPFIHSIYKPPL